MMTGMSHSPPPLRPRLTIPLSPPRPRNGEVQSSISGLYKDTDSASTPATASLLSPVAMPLPIVHTFFDKVTGFRTYIVVDPVTEEAVVIDPISNLKMQTNQSGTNVAHSILDTVENEGYIVTLILETGLHRKHNSGSRYVQGKLSKASGRRPRLCTGRKVDKTVGVSNAQESPSEHSRVDNHSFDKLFADAEKFRIGNIVGEVMFLSTAGKSCCAGSFDLVAYLFGSNIFTNIPNGIGSLTTCSRHRLLEHSDGHTVWGVPLDPSRPNSDSVTIGILRGHRPASNSEPVT